MNKRSIFTLAVISLLISFNPGALLAVTEFSKAGISAADSKAIPENDIQLKDNNSAQNDTDGKAATPGKDDNDSSVQFREVWGYLMRGEEKLFKGDEPVTDICYFSCSVGSQGRININVAPPVLPDLNGKKRRIHMVIADLENTALMHKTLNPEFGMRDRMVGDIIELSKKFDGIQIDFEAVADRDAAAFHEFLKMIKAGMEPGKVFSVALPSRVSAIPGDAYDYSIISSIVDKVYIMAYDQHWSTSKPGPVASLSWCRSIMDFAKNVIPADKLVMGIPLYGREWEERYVKGKKIKVVEYKKVAAGKKSKKSKYKKVVRTVKIPPRVEKTSRSVKSGSLNRLAYGSRAEKGYSIDKGVTIKIQGKGFSSVLYCDDVQATKEKFVLYRGYVDSVGFWRLGMQCPEMWREIRIVD